MSKEQATYSHGHHASVVNSHARRTVHDSAGFLIPFLRPTDRILDLGCGPGSITIGLARLVPQGHVIGLDASESVISQAQTLAATERVSNISFATADANALPYDDDSFDVVFAHQVLQHVHDPVGVLREMARVAKPGGIVAARDADYSTIGWYPSAEVPLLRRWRELYEQQAKANGGEPDGGRLLHVWARKAGFKGENVRNTVSNWCYTGQRAVEWAESWVQRALHSGFAETLRRKNFATDEEIQAISQAWKEWSTMEDLWFSIPSGEMLYRLPH